MVANGPTLRATNEPAGQFASTDAVPAHGAATHDRSDVTLGPLHEPPPTSWKIVCDLGCVKA
jgi:hypothetical protein